MKHQRSLIKKLNDDFSKGMSGAMLAEELVVVRGYEGRSR